MTDFINEQWIITLNHKSGFKNANWVQLFWGAMDWTFYATLWSQRPLITSIVTDYGFRRSSTFDVLICQKYEMKSSSSTYDYLFWMAPFSRGVTSSNIDKYFSLVEVTTSRQLNKVHDIINIAFVFVIKSE